MKSEISRLWFGIAVVSVFALFANFPDTADLFSLVADCEHPAARVAIENAVSHLMSTVLETCITRNHPDLRCIEYFEAELEYIVKKEGVFVCADFSRLTAVATSQFCSSLTNFRELKYSAENIGRRTENRRVGSLRVGQQARDELVGNVRPQGEPLSYGFGARVPWTNFQVQTVGAPGQAWTSRVSYVNYDLEGKKLRLFEP